MAFLVFSGLFNGLISVSLGMLAFARAPRNAKNLAYIRYCGSIAVWSFGYCAWQLAASEPVALWAFRVLMLGAVSIPITHLHHVVTLLECEPAHRRLLRIGYALTGLLGILVFTPSLQTGFHAAMGFAYWPTAGPGLPWYLLWFVFCVGYATYLFRHAYRTAAEKQRIQYRALMVSYLVGYAGGMTNFPVWYGIAFPPYGTILVSVYVVVVASILIHYRLLDFSVTVERSLPYIFGIAVFLTPAFALFLYAQQVFLGSVHARFSMVVALIVCIFFFLGVRMMGNMQSALANLLFRERHVMYDAMTQFSKSLVMNLDLHSLARDLVQTVGHLMGIRHVTLYVLNQDQKVFLPVSRYGETVPDKGLRIPIDAPLPQWLFARRDLVHCAELEHDSSVPDDVKQSLTALAVEVCMPLINKDTLLGFCLLGQRASREDYSSTDLALLRMLAQEAAIALDNARLHEELKRSQALVRRTDRLRSLETMAGGLAHEIRNPLTSIKAFVDLAPERRHDEEFLVRFSRIVKDDVARIERLTREILDYARPVDPYLQRESLNEIVESCLHSIRLRPAYRAISFRTELAGDLPAVWVDRQQIKQVLLNLLLNGLEAMSPDGGVLTVRTYRIRKGDQPEQVCVEVGDTGPGIAQHDLDHIFDPFFTTKHLSSEHEGTGLGLAIAHQIVEEHRGSIEVTSEPGHGTTFLVSLPACQPEETERRQREERDQHATANGPPPFPEPTPHHGV